MARMIYTYNHPTKGLLTGKLELFIPAGREITDEHMRQYSGIDESDVHWHLLKSPKRVDRVVFEYEDGKYIIGPMRTFTAMSQGEGRAIRKSPAIGAPYGNKHINPPADAYRYVGRTSGRFTGTMENPQTIPRSLAEAEKQMQEDWKQEVQKE